MLSGCCAQSGGDAQGHYSQYAQVPDVEKGGGAAKKKATPAKKKVNLPPKKKGGPPGRKSVQEDSEVRCFFVVLGTMPRLVVPCGGVGCPPRFYLLRSDLPTGGG